VEKDGWFSEKRTEYQKTNQTRNVTHLQTSIKNEPTKQHYPITKHSTN